MNLDQRQALTCFAQAIQQLKAVGVIRSDRYLGDIAEFLCADMLGIELERNQRQEGHDGTRQGLKVQIKYGGGKKKNMDFKNPDMYDEIYVVLGKNSAVRTHSHPADFLVYRFESAEVMCLRRSKNEENAYSCGGSKFKRAPDHVIFVSEELEVG